MRLVLMVLWTLFCGLPLPIAALVGCGNRVRHMRANAWCIRFWSRGLLRIVGVKVRVEGVIPEPGQFLVSNHQSWVDVIVLSSIYPMNWVAKREVRQIPVMGWLTERAGILFIDQQKVRDTQRIGEQLRRYLEAGLSFSLFAEGFCADGRSLKPFRSPLFAPAAQLGVPCVPTAIHYDLAEVVWTDQSPVSVHARRLLRARRRRGGPIHATVRFAEPVVGHDRKELTRQVESRVAAMFRPVG